MFHSTRTALVLGVASLSPLLFGVARGADNAPGSTIEVREGDTWSKAKVVTSEGRKVRVRYDDGTEEWIGPDRLRAGGAAPAARTAPPDGAEKTGGAPAAPKPGSRAFAADQSVEVKRDGKWHTAQIRQVAPNWIFVAEDEDERQQRWIEPWAVRVAGSAYDIAGQGTGIWPSSPGQIAPRDRPGKAPATTGDPFVVTPADQRPPGADHLEKNFENVSFDNVHEPATGGDASLHVPTTQPTGEFAAWALRGNEEISALFTCPNSLKIAVAAFDGSFGKWTSVTRINLLAHSQLDTRSLRVSDVKVVAAANEGDLLLTTFSWDKNLQLWQWNGQAYKLMCNLRVDPDVMASIQTASLIAPDKAVVAVGTGMVYLVDLTKKNVVSSVKIAPNSSVFVHPSGQIVGVITSSGTALILRAADFSVVAEFTDAGSAGNVSVDPTGQWAAYLTNAGVVRVVKIADGTQLGLLAVGAAFKGRLDLVDDKFLLVDHATAYDVKSGIPVWIYKLPDLTNVAALANGQFLIAARQLGNNMVSVAMASIPDQVGRAALKSAARNRFMLAPGMAIKVEADYSGFGEQKQQASDAVEHLITSAGMTVSNNKDEAFVLALSIAPGPTEKRDYAPDMFSGPYRKVTTVDVPSNILTANLKYKGEAVWSQEIRFAAGGMIQRDANHSFQDVVNVAAKPNAEALKSLNVPSYLPTGAKPGTPAALGLSTLQDRRFAPERPVAAPKAPRP